MWASLECIWCYINIKYSLSRVQALITKTKGIRVSVKTICCFQVFGSEVQVLWTQVWVQVLENYTWVPCYQLLFLCAQTWVEVSFHWSTDNTASILLQISLICHQFSWRHLVLVRYLFSGQEEDVLLMFCFMLN